MPEKTRRNPRGAGRKPRGPNNSTERVTVRLTEDERSLFDAEAAAAGLSLVEWIRDTCLDRAQRPKRKTA